MDFTGDFETCSLSANAAVMQVALVPWLRDSECDPFCSEQEIEPFVGYVDLRTCVVDGFDFDQETVEWWSRQSEAARRAVTSGYAEPIADVLVGLLDYVRRVVKDYGLKSICLWCQGPDVDIAILRNLCRKYDVNLEEIVPHTQFRDCRTIIMEAAHIRARMLMQENRSGNDPVILPGGVLCGDRKAYSLFAPLPERYANGSEPHDALYDALQSSWNTWQALRWMNG